MDGTVAGWPTGHRRMGAGSRVTLARSGAQYTTTPRQDGVLPKYSADSPRKTDRENHGCEYSTVEPYRHKNGRAATPPEGNYGRRGAGPDVYAPLLTRDVACIFTSSSRVPEHAE
jgi:hypothetical protein